MNDNIIAGILMMIMILLLGYLFMRDTVTVSGFTSGSEAPVAAPVAAPSPVPAHVPAATKKDLEKLYNDIMVKIDAVTAKVTATPKAPAPQPTPCTQQGKEYLNPDYIRKDSIPCWGCKL